jgi:hypothetical protein
MAVEYTPTVATVTLSGIRVIIKNNLAHLPSSQSSWKKGWGVFNWSETLGTTDGFDAATQVTINTKI